MEVHQVRQIIAGGKDRAESQQAAELRILSKESQDELLIAAGIKPPPGSQCVLRLCDSEGGSSTAVAPNAEADAVPEASWCHHAVRVLDASEDRRRAAIPADCRAASVERQEERKRADDRGETRCPFCRAASVGDALHHET